MDDVLIAGIGQIPVGEHWETALRSLAARAVRAALRDCPGLKPQALYIGNTLAGRVSHQANLGALLTQWCGLEGIEGVTVETAGSSGASAILMAMMAVASGVVDCAVALGVEKMTDLVGTGLAEAVAEAGDGDYETAEGLTPAAQAGLLMRRYLHETGAPRGVFAEMPMIAHANAAHNPHAMFRRELSRKAYERAELIADPLNRMDEGPWADGAAAVVLTRASATPRALRGRGGLVRLAGAAAAADTLALHDRQDPLAFEAARISMERACRMAGVLPGEADFFELCDAYSIYGLLSLEASGFAERGEGWRLLMDGSLRPGGRLPALTLGGQKARGNPLGAAGAYQTVEAVLQLRGQAGAGQVPGARRGLVQSLGGPASSAVTLILERWEG